MISKLWLISGVFAVVAVASFFLWAYGVQFNATQVAVVSLLLVSLIIVAILVKVFRDNPHGGLAFSQKGDDMERAAKVAINFWNVLKGEELDLREAHGTERSFGRETAFGFLFHRIPGLGTSKSGAPVVMVVRANPLRVVRWSDEPTADEQENPFLIWSASYTGAPVPGLMPEADASFQKFRYAPKTGQTFNIGATGGSEMEDFFSGRKREERQ